MEDKREAHYKVEVRDPYMGNWIPVKLKLIWVDGQLTGIWAINPEGISIKAEPDTDV